jgi:hypothetical protein
MHLDESTAQHAGIDYLHLRLCGILAMHDKQSRQAWEIARQQAYWTILPHIDVKRQKQFKAKSLGEFPWEKAEAKRQEKLKQLKKRQQANG